MKLKTLIKILQRYDGDLEVFQEYDCMYSPLERRYIKNEINIFKYPDQSYWTNVAHMEDFPAQTGKPRIKTVFCL